MENIGRILGQLRQDLGLSQAELARRLGITRASVHKWERGDALPTLHHLQEIARIMGVSISSIIESGAVGVSIDAELAMLDAETAETLRASFLTTIKHFRARKTLK